MHRAAHYGYSLLVARAECHPVRMLYRCVASWPTDCPSSMGLRTRKACTNELRASPFALCVVSGGSKVRWLRGSSASAPGPVASSTRLISPPPKKTTAILPGTHGLSGIQAPPPLSEKACLKNVVRVVGDCWPLPSSVEYFAQP